ncbi:unnamed protein product [marine sediment metagenome]|uniref:Uncharacterized protein n=1 Tax=marine sediment metagenome TaxID=412755 RepID=X0ZAM6_9ZZZZ
MRLPNKEEGWYYDERNHAFQREIIPEETHKITNPSQQLKSVFNINELELILE